MTSAFNLTPYQQNNLAAVCSIGQERLRRVVDELDQSGFKLARADVEKAISGILGEDQGSELAAFLFGITAGYRNDSSAPDTTLRMIDEFVATKLAADVRFQAWSQCRSELSRLLESRSVRLAAKALDVSYDFERVYTNGRFVTSLRPVFDEARKEVVGATIVQTLRLDYFSATGDHTTLSVALDRMDIEQLMKSCQEALGKADVIFHKSRNEWNLPTIMSGRDTSS